MDFGEPSKTMNCEIKTEDDKGHIDCSIRDNRTLEYNFGALQGFGFIDCKENIKEENKELFDPFSANKKLSEVNVFYCEETIKEEIKEEEETIDCKQTVNPIEEVEHDGKEECTYCKKRFMNVNHHLKRNSGRCSQLYQKFRQKLGYFDPTVQCAVCKKKVRYLNTHLQRSKECRKYSKGYHGYFRGVDWKQECKKCKDRFKDLYKHLQSSRECKQYYDFNEPKHNCKICGSKVRDLKSHTRQCERQHSEPDDGLEKCFNCKKRFKNLYDHLRSNDECKPDA